MTALDPSSADRVLAMPGGASFTSLPFGDVAFEAYQAASQSVETTAYGFPAIRRDGGGTPTALQLDTTGPITPPAAWTLMVAFDSVDEMALGPASLLESPWVQVVAGPEFAPMVLAGLQNIAPNSPPRFFDPALDGEPVVFVVSASSVEDCFFATDREGVLFTGDPMASPGDQTAGALSLPNSGEQRLLGMWLWEGDALSQADAVDTAQAIAATLRGEGPSPEPSGPSTVGEGYRAAVVQSVFGAAASGVIPSVLWGAWLDDELNVLATTGVEVSQTAFDPTPTGVANTVIIDGGVCPASVPAHFALLDAEVDGQIVAYAPVTFGSEPEPGDPIAFAPGALAFNYGA